MSNGFATKKVGPRTPLEIFDDLFRVGNCHCSSCRWFAFKRKLGIPLALIWKALPVTLLALILWRVW